MKIGIDLSQTAFEETGVSNYTLRLVEKMIKNDKKNEYIIFFASLRKKLKLKISSSNIIVKTFPISPSMLDFLWNKIHIFPIEWFIGNIDIFICSDWTEPPVLRAKKITIIHDMIVFTHPNNTDNNIVNTQKRKLNWSKKECNRFICVSESTKKDFIEIMEIDAKKVSVIYPGA
ncbi:hypothetical protein LBMAG33_1630 [Candidatus Levyibacteriota bacterium]|nr:glycosyltransferase [Candidatus Levybacteria bacterium]MSU25811.1 hypothetical protein [Candidatus Levybacteria bacterium]GDX61853.1 hypothetical protein LBMAG33_1630 [Candidatus Levybacteria bacterium]